MSTSFHDNKKTTLGVSNTAAKVYPRGAISISMLGQARQNPYCFTKENRKRLAETGSNGPVCDFLRSDVDCRPEVCSLWDNWGLLSLAGLCVLTEGEGYLTNPT